ncbi:MAG: branched-chain amino acid transport system substrate-binding protein [Actinomycetota bacterium]|nr:branched-chain amino acid transport system substrate-binding protein [Actinomycetota bacterium]
MRLPAVRLDQWRLHLAAVVALLLVLAVASLGGADSKAVSQRLAAEQRAANGGGKQATSTGIPLDNLQVASGGAATGGSGPAGAATGGKAAGAAPAGGRHGIYDQGVSDTEIRVGGSTFTSGPAAVYGEQIAVGFAAGVNYINEHGGINGRRVILKIYDDGGDPAKQLANTKRLVEIDKVFALTMSYAPIVGNYVSDVGIPVYHLGQFNEEFTNPWYFPVGGPQRTASYQMANFGAKHLGVKSVAVFYLDAGAANYSKEYAAKVKSDWQAYGVEVPVLAGFAPDQTSCSDAISQARSAGVEFIDFEIDAGKVINCGVEAQIQGYKPSKSWGGYLIGVPVIHEALGDYAIGMYAFDAFGANYDVQAYKDAVRKVSSKTESYSSVTASYFISAMLMRDSIAKLGDNITRTRLRDTVNTMTDWTPGLTDDPNQPHWTWRANCHLALKGGYVIQIQKQDDGKLKWVQTFPGPKSAYTTNYLPPGASPPPEFAACKSFTPG